MELLRLDQLGDARLGVDHEHAVGAGEHPDGATHRIGMGRIDVRRAGEGVEVRREPLRPDLQPGKVDGRRRRSVCVSCAGQGPEIARISPAHAEPVAARQQQVEDHDIERARAP
jgi:hypothetical protein